MREEALRNLSEFVHNPIMKTGWKYEPVCPEKIELPKFLDGSVKKDGEIYKFDFLGMEYDPDWQMLTIDGVDIELKANFNLKNSEARKNFDKVNKSDYKPKKILKTLQKYIRAVKSDNSVPITQLIFKMVEENETGAQNNDLVQAVKNLLMEAELQDTYAGYVMPQKNNICKPIRKKDIIKFIKDVTGIRGISSETVEKALSYFNDEVEPVFNCIVTANGYYDFNKGRFFESSPEPIIIKKASPYNYRVELIDTEPPKKLKKFLEETFSDNFDKIPQLLEIFGYMLTDGNPAQKLPFFSGKGRNGKGVCLELLSDLVDNNVSNVDLFSVDLGSKYSAPLIESDINIINEVKSVKNIAEIKDYIGGSGLQLSKVYKDSRKYTDDELPKSILATNNFKGLEQELDHPMLRRLSVFIEFNNIVPENKVNPHLVREIKAEEDSMDWLLTNSIYLYQQTNNKFSAGHDNDETFNHLQKYIDPVAYTIEQDFYYNVDEFRELANYPTENWDRFVSKDDIIQHLGVLNIEVKIGRNDKNLKEAICSTFNLIEPKYKPDNYKDGLLDFEILNNYKLGAKKTFIVGVLKKYVSSYDDFCDEIVSTIEDWV